VELLRAGVEDMTPAEFRTTTEGHLSRPVLQVASLLRAAQEIAQDHNMKPVLRVMLMKLAASKRLT
jgi:hypothetical protein